MKGGEKQYYLIFLAGIFIVLLSTSFVSAGWLSDFIDSYFGSGRAPVLKGPGCTDSDGGINYFVKGIGSDKYGYSGTDGCLSNKKYLFEYYCSGPLLGDILLSEQYTCVNGCNDGACISNGSCTNECSTAGAKQCSSSGIPQVCATDGDSDSCLEWKNLANCPSGQTCQSGDCVIGCTNECSSTGSKRCSGTNSETCGNFDADSCLEWGGATFCSAGCNSATGNCNAACTDSDGGINFFTRGTVLNVFGGTATDFCDRLLLIEYYCNANGGTDYQLKGCSQCNNGACVNSSSCTPKTCSGLAKQCGSWDNGCGTTLNCGTCPTGKSCDANGQCVIGCSNECSSAGLKQCSATGIPQICAVDGDADSCLDWKNLAACATGQSCSNGECVSGCTNECSSTGSKRCNGQNSESCGNYDADSCLEWGSSTFCKTGCNNATGSCNTTCTPLCSGKQCGPDGCGGSCGTCPNRKSCNTFGQCVIASDCTDSDGGKNYFVKGIGSDKYGYSGTDGCLSNKKYLFEYYCSGPLLGDILLSEQYTCVNGCNDGACVSTSCIPKTCSQLGKQCGSWNDGCGATLNCGSCSTGSCNSTGQCVADIPPSLNASISLATLKKIYRIKEQITLTGSD